MTPEEIENFEREILVDSQDDLLLKSMDFAAFLKSVNAHLSILSNRQAADIICNALIQYGFRDEIANQIAVQVVEMTLLD